VVRDDDFGLEFSGLNVLQQFRHETLRMGLPHPGDPALFECIAKQETVNSAGVDVSALDDLRSMLVDHENTLGIEQPGRCCRHQTYRSGAEYGNRRPGGTASQDG